LAALFTLRARSIGFTTGSREPGEPKSLNKTSSNLSYPKPAEEREGCGYRETTTRMKADRRRYHKVEK
jgi:hypothetical protein